MDLETENRLAAMLMKEAAELRRQSEREGVHVYLRKPNVRARPNSRFLTATVLGVQQANRVVEVNEMWRVRQKEQELDDRLEGKLKDQSSNGTSLKDDKLQRSIRPTVAHDSGDASCSSSKGVSQSSNSIYDDGLRDEEVEEFLRLRVKRGRGAIGSRMDETGPYLPHFTDSKEEWPTSSDVVKHRAVFSPEKPPSLKKCRSSEKEIDDVRQKKQKKDRSKSSKKDRSKSSKKDRSEKHKSKNRSKDTKKRKEKRSKHNK